MAEGMDMDYARIEDGIVREIVTVPDGLTVTVPGRGDTLVTRPATIADLFAPGLVFVPAGPEVRRGMVYDADTGFAAAPPPEQPAPAAVEMRQFRIALHRAGLLAALSAAASVDAETAIEWDYATVVPRDGRLAALTGLSAPALDALFVVAAAI